MAPIGKIKQFFKRS